MIETILRVAENILDVTVAVAPWLLLGLVLAAAVRIAIPDALLHQWLGGNGFSAVTRGAVVGAPLPLCSCGAIPTALSLYRGGASRGGSTAFLVSTPSIGIDSVILTWVLLGPIMVLARVAGALGTAVGAGLAVGRFGGKDGAGGSECCGGCCSPPAAAAEASSHGWLQLPARLAVQIRELIDDIGGWLLAGLVLAGLILTFIPPGAVATWGSGFLAMALLAVVGIPLYICAVAATPIAAAMLIAGVSPGAVLVFLIAGPVTSFATLMILRREMGGRTAAVYLASLLIGALTVGLLFDAVAAVSGYQPAALAGAAPEIWPGWLERAAAGIMLVLIIAPARRAVVRSGEWAWAVARGGRG